MKRVFNYLAVAASALLVLSACTSDKLEAYSGQPDTNPESPDNAITFGTYVGKSGVTRAGATDAMTTTQLQSTGFGVFAYYTGTTDYAQNTVANFMYNQQVTHGTDWTYSPIKYWPNEVGTNVDDQNNDTGNDPATSTNSNGGKVSFFAYAPYVSAAISETTSGIIEINEATSLAGTAPTGTPLAGGTGNQKIGDPTIKYKFATDGNNVDLLWGTLDPSTGVNVLGANNAGKAYNGSGTTYEQAILNGYTVGADLTKQKVEGKVSFAFKHALAKVGGATMTSTPGTVSDKSGLLVQLDIDKDGSEIGGDKDPNTVVTIESITIKNCEVEYDSNDDGTTDATNWVTGGVFNLATGKWTGLTTGSESDAVTQTIKRDGANPAGNAKLNDDIAEPESVTKMETTGGGTEYTLNDSHIPGVSTTKKAVYKEDASPFVFIPGTKPSFTVEVTYIVRTFDSNLASTANDDTGTGSPKVSTWSKVKQTIKKKVTFNDVVQLNKQYTLIMHLGLTSVKFEATVSNWELRGDDNNNGVIDDGETAVDITDVYLPINVQGETTAQTVAAGSNVTVNTAASNTTYTINMTGLTASESYTEAHTGNVSSVTTGSADGDGKANITVTLTPNRTNQPVVNTVTITGSTSGKVSVITITQNPDKTYTLTPTVIGQAASSTGTITVGGGTVSSVTATTTPSGLTAAVSSNVVTYTASSANDTGAVKTYEGIVLTINDGTNDYTYTTSITQATTTP